MPYPYAGLYGPGSHLGPPRPSPAQCKRENRPQGARPPCRRGIMTKGQPSAQMRKRSNPPRPPAHAPMTQFAVQHGELVVGGQPLSQLSQHVGGTPFFAYDSALLAARIDQLRTMLPEAIELHYAIKANPFPDLVRFMAKRVDGLDVASGGELALARESGFPANAISFAGPGKSRSELEQEIGRAHV